MRWHLSEWVVALGLALAVHTLFLVFWYWAPTPVPNAGAGGVSVALAPVATVRDDRMVTQTTETDEPLPPVEEPEIIQPPKPVTEALPVRRVDQTPPQVATELAPSSAPAAVAAVTNNIGPGSASAEAGIGNEEAKVDYIARLADRLARYKRYPRAAQRRGLEGVTKLSFTVRRDGTLVTYKIIQSAGYQVLDREVERTLERALPFPPFPQDLTQTTLDIIIPIRFELKGN